MDQRREKEGGPVNADALIHMLYTVYKYTHAIYMCIYICTYLNMQCICKCLCICMLYMCVQICAHKVIDWHVGSHGEADQAQVQEVTLKSTAKAPAQTAGLRSCTQYPECCCGLLESIYGLWGLQKTPGRVS